MQQWAVEVYVRMVTKAPGHEDELDSIGDENLVKDMLTGTQVCGRTQTLMPLSGIAVFDSESSVPVTYTFTDQIPINERKWRGTPACINRTPNYGA